MAEMAGKRGVLGEAGQARRWLLVVAASVEAEAIAQALGARAPNSMWRTAQVDPRFEMVVSGVGKANAAGATALALDPARHGGVISIGVGGALLDEQGAPLAAVLDTVVGSASLFGDEGIERDAGWATIAALGFPPCTGLPDEPDDGVRCTRELGERLGGIANHAGTIATVSTCSATDASAQAVRARTGAIAEAMEGAAVGLAARRAWLSRGGRGACPFLELRIISNLTGSGGGAWQLDEALARLGDVARVL